MNRKPKNRIIILNHPQDVHESEHMCYDDFLATVDGDSVLTTTQLDVIEDDDDILWAMHESWKILFYNTGSMSTCYRFEARIAKLLERTSEPPLVFVNRNERQLLDAKRTSEWLTPHPGTGNRQLILELCTQLQRLGARGVPMGRDWELKWMKDLMTYNDRLVAASADSRPFIRDDPFDDLTALWNTMWEYYTEF